MMSFLVKVGYDDDHLLDFPIDKIGLIYRDAKEEEANAQLLHLDTSHAAFAAVMGDKDYQRGFRKFRESLLEAAGYELTEDAKKKLKTKQKRITTRLIMLGLAKPLRQ